MKGSIPRFGFATALLFLATFREAAAATQIPIPSITGHPTSRFVTIGSNVTFSVTAQSVGAAGFQWFKDGQPLGGQTNNALVITNVQTVDRGFYHAVVRNAAAAVASQQAFLVPQSTAPASSGGAVLFRTSPYAPVTNFYFNERLSGDAWVAQLYAAPLGSQNLVPIGLPEKFSLPGFIFGGTNFIPSVVPGGQAVVEMRVWSIRDGDTYEQAYANFRLNGRSNPIVVTTGAGSNPANLTGLQGFLIARLDGQRGISFPRDQQASVGGTATFSTEMFTCVPPNCGTNAAPFEWRRNGILIPGATSASLVLANVDVADAATYTFTTGGIRSPCYALTVLLNPQFLPIRRESPGDVRLRIRSATGSIIGVETSSNLLDWTSVAILTNQSGVVEYIDSTAPASSQRFYRSTSQ